MEMRKLNLVILLLLIPSLVQAAAPTRQYNYVAHTTIDPVQVNTNENALYSYLQAGVDTYTAGSITNTAINANAAISYTKLNLLGSIVNADISPTAAIIGSKLDLSSPGIIGSGTPAAGTFTTLTANTSLTSSAATVLNGTVNLGVTHQGDTFYDNGTSVVRLTPGTSGQFLETLGTSANPLWATPPSTSNVLFQYLGSVTAQGSGIGEVTATVLTGATTGNYRYLEAPGLLAYTAEQAWKFVKIAGINTVTIWTKLWSATTGSQASLKVDIGSTTGNVSGTLNQTSPEWNSFTIDVSGLSNGTTYDVTASLRDAQGNTGTKNFCGIIMGFGS